MVKRINVNNTFFTDLDSYADMIIEPIEVKVKTETSIMLKGGFRVVGCKSDGRQFVLFTDDKSGKPDECLNWISKNWLNK